MRARFTLILLMTALGAAAQLPPITVEWSALRPYPTDEGPNAHISRDPTYGHYVWAVMDLDLINDEVANLFLPDGTDVTPSNPIRFSVGSLDRLIDLAVRDSAVFDLMMHQSLFGIPFYWHLQRVPLDGSDNEVLWDHVNLNPDASGSLSDLPFDLMLTADATYGCGTSEIVSNLDSSRARVVKTDLQGNLLWDTFWEAPSSPNTAFSSMAIVGDSLLCAAFPYLVVFDRATGDLISALDISNGNSGFSFSAQLLAYGQRVYFTGGARVGYYDLSNGQTVFVNATGGTAPRIAIDQFDHVWTTVGNNWARWTSDLVPIDSGTLYESIDDMCLVNGKITLTGIFDSANSMAYAVTGTPLP